MPAMRNTMAAATALMLASTMLIAAEDPQPVNVFEEPLVVPKRYEATDPKSVLASFVDFEFGLATAPAHVEDQLEDAWLDFARKGKVAAWQNAPMPEERTRFWSEPEVDIKLAADTGVTIFRMGIDWARLVPNLESATGILVPTAWSRYVEILKMVKDAGMKIMLTIFHHSLPIWLQKTGGWTNSSSVDFFGLFIEAVVRGLKEEPEVVDALHSILPFNEPHVFALLTYCGGMWPGGDPNASSIEQLNCFSPWGGYGISMANMAKAHSRAYHAVRNANMCTPIGVAHHVPSYSALSVFDKPAQRVTESMTTFWFHDLIQHECDLIGINYYGREIIAGVGVAMIESEEYSDAGRSIYPDGLYRILRAFHARYAQPLIITENGLADATDKLRPSYFIEHLLAIKAAMETGVPVKGYVFWTISDNWEWADGYCPQFGLVHVDRNDPKLKRTKRPSYHIFSKVVKSNTITAGVRAEAWEKVASAASREETHPFCRADDGQSSRETPIDRTFSKRDWRFGKRPPLEHDKAARRALKSVQDKWTDMSQALEKSWSDASREVSQAWDAWANAKDPKERGDVDDRSAAQMLSGFFDDVRNAFNAAADAGGDKTAELRAEFDKHFGEAESAMRNWQESFEKSTNDFGHADNRGPRRWLSNAASAVWRVISWPFTGWGGASDSSKAEL